MQPDNSFEQNITISLFSPWNKKISMITRNFGNISFYLDFNNTNQIQLTSYPILIGTIDTVAPITTITMSGNVKIINDSIDYYTITTSNTLDINNNPILNTVSLPVTKSNILNHEIVLTINQNNDVYVYSPNGPIELNGEQIIINGYYTIPYNPTN